MTESDNIVTMQGNSLHLVGQSVEVGDDAPDFEALNTDLETVRLSDFRGKVVILASVPSLDTPVCDMETRRFNKEATAFGDNLVVLTVSMDLPFAQKRWCGASGIDKVVTLSDHRDAAFGHAYGVLIEELRLLARAVFVVDVEGRIVHKQMVKEITEEPDYDSVLGAVRLALG